MYAGGGTNPCARFHVGTARAADGATIGAAGAGAGAAAVGTVGVGGANTGAGVGTGGGGAGVVAGPGTDVSCRPNATFVDMSGIGVPAMCVLFAGVWPNPLSLLLLQACV